jgi:hypothetical protein
MTGYPDFNFPMFGHYAALLRDQGYVVLSPHESAGGVTDLPREWYFTLDFAMLSTANYIFLMPGWEHSAGSKAEAIMASEIGVGVFEVFVERDGHIVLTPIEDIEWYIGFQRGESTW